jgi:DNA primase
MWDQRKSNQGKGDMWAPCPFHQEKSASFHVDDRKGFYYCFGCQAKGDAISFLKDCENLSFMEAVEVLAGEAGMTIPARDPDMQQKTDARMELNDVMEKAVRFFRMMLNSREGSQTNTYLEKRGLSRATQDQFGLGYAPGDRKALYSALTAQGVSAEQLIESGMCIKPDDGGQPYDRFRNRVMFPIRDGRGLCIAFGGRALDASAKAKYLNSPETILFDKGRSLYNQGPARSALGKKYPLIVAEGYMDVIALAQVGFSTAVAPLGTAITENQLMLMWRMHSEPIIALDGDTAGLRAAYRLIDVALPLLETGRALRFAIMPKGQDPDDLIRSGGAGAFQDLLDKAIPMVELMWRQATEGQVFDSPERKSVLDEALRGRIRRIKEPRLRSLYENAVKDMRWAFFRPVPSQRIFKKGGFGKPLKQPVSQSTKVSALVSGDKFIADNIREAVIAAALVNCPSAIESLVDELQMLELRNAELNQIIRILCDSEIKTRAEAEIKITEILGPDALEKLFSESHVQIMPCIRQPENVKMAKMTVLEELAKLASQRGLAAELQEVSESAKDGLDETDIWRLGRAADAKNKASLSDTDDKAEYDLADNGARVNRDERSALDHLIGKIGLSRNEK